jgi:hypothetical protein
MQVIEMMEPTSGLEPLTCRLRNLCGESLLTNPISFNRSCEHERAQMQLIVQAGDTFETANRRCRGHSLSGVRMERNIAALHKAEIAVASHRAAEIE